MLKAVIAMASDDLTDILMHNLDCRFSVVCCYDGNTALHLLDKVRPEILILDLSLPGLDGFAVLEQAKEFLPPVILATTDLDSAYIRSASPDKGIGYIIRLPANVTTITTRLLDMVNEYTHSREQREKSRLSTVQLLLSMNFRTHLNGYTQLLAAIPLFAEDPSLRMTKELYPLVASLTGFSGTDQIERSIRSAIKDAWKHRNSPLWSAYFPDEQGAKRKCPSNKLFISRMAEALNQKL